MENDYIKVFILPEVGGKIYGAIEKSTKKEFIYLNHVLKFRQIAMRGPWTSGGIEFNFGLVGHSPATATPINYLIRKNSDGSVSCIIGTMDLPSRTRWSVIITLPADKAYFEIRPLWYNPSPFHQSYYCWINNAIKVGEDLQYFYPGRFVVPHGYSVPMEPWPVDKKGRDLSWYKNNNFGGSKSHFVLGKYEDYYGAYWHSSRFGFGHWALYDDMPGKKVWMWALSRQGAIWENLLTDKDGQYSEPQAGRLFSQSDHSFFSPYTADTWREILFPFKEIGGMVKASPVAVVNVNRKNKSLLIGICPLQKIDDNLIVIIDNKAIYQEQIHLKPMEVYKKNISLSQTKGELQVLIGKNLYYTNKLHKNDVNRPISYHRINEKTAEGLYLSGEFYEKRRQYNTALKKYKECLKKEPLHIRALTRIAEIYCRRAQYEKGLECVSRALKNDMYNPDANYVYGVISRYTGNLIDAKETLGWAARSMNYRSNAYCQIAEIYIQEKNFETAVEYAHRSIDFNKYNLKSYEVMAVAYRKLNKIENAKNILNRLLEIEPLNYLARFELYLLEPGPKNLDNFKSIIHSELPWEHYLEMATFYSKLNLECDAIKVLKQAPSNPIIYFWLAYLLREKSPQQSQNYLKKAIKISPELIFPFREETIPVLKWAIKTNPDNWKVKYYLGLIYWGKGREKEALKIFATCGEPDFAPFYIILGYLEKKLYSKNPISLYKKAFNINKKDWRNWHYLANIYNQYHQFDKALQISKEAVKNFPDEVILGMDYASSLFNTGNYVECLKKLEKMEVLPYEGGWEAHNLFMRANVHLAMENIKNKNYKNAIIYLEKSKEYPEHLGTGKPYDPDYRLQDYLEALCYDKINEKNKAEKSRKLVYDYTIKKWIGGGNNHYFGLLALKSYGEKVKALKLLNELKSIYPDNLIVKWTTAKFTAVSYTHLTLPTN